jgi:cytochrome bd ubiquinol oxidase subunit I
MDALTADRIHFGFTIVFHYLFPQLTMGLALLILILKTVGLRTSKKEYDQAAQFWARIFAINFVMGVVTGIPMEFQFGTNWAAFSQQAGGVIGQTLAMEGLFSFFLESSFLGLFLFGEKRLGPRLHWLSSLLVFLGSWLSGFFIIATNAWMQHPVGYRIAANGAIELQSFWALLSNPWLIWQYPHNMSAAVITGSVVMSATGAFYLLTGQHDVHARIFVRTGVIAGAIASCLMMYPLGDAQALNVATYQPLTLSAMEGLFHSEKGAPLAIFGQPDMRTQKLQNPFVLPDVLSFLTYRRWHAVVKGLDAYPQSDWPDNVPLLYYAYHNMVGLGTFFIAILVFALFALWRGWLYESPLMLWALMLLAPFPYIATIFGWMTAELGRQPWLIYGVMRTAQGASPQVGEGDVLFTLVGFLGMYAVLSVLFLFLVYFEVQRGPGAEAHGAAAPVPVAAPR